MGDMDTSITWTLPLLFLYEDHLRYHAMGTVLQFLIPHIPRFGVMTVIFSRRLKLFLSVKLTSPEVFLF